MVTINKADEKTLKSLAKINGYAYDTLKHIYLMGKAAEATEMYEKCLEKTK